MSFDQAMQLLEAMRIAYEEHHMSVVLVLNNTEEGTLSAGSGFIIRSTGAASLVMTNHRCVETPRNLRIRLASSLEEYPSTIPYGHSRADLAILRVQIPQRPALVFRETVENVSIGPPVFMVAYFHPRAQCGLRLNPDVQPGMIW